MSKVFNKRNLILFIVSYFLNNLVSGLMYDTYVNYLQEVAVDIAKSFWAYYGYATFISAALLLLANKIGYKWLVVISNVGCALALGSILVGSPSKLLYFTTLFGLTGVQLHFILLAPFVADCLPDGYQKSIDWYSRTYYIGYIGYFLTTFLGGILTVKMFAVHNGTTYAEAKEITKYIEDYSGEIREAYVAGNRDVLIMGFFIALAAIIPSLMLTNSRGVASGETLTSELKGKLRISRVTRLFKNKKADYYILYWVLISFAMGLFTSYYTIFLNRNLHIDRAVASELVSISYIAIVLFMLFTPTVVKKLGIVHTITFAVLFSIPFMLIIANGDIFGRAMIPMVGIALFMRAGLANLSSPAESELSMEIVDEDLRPTFTAMINFASGIISILSGNFTGNILFVTQEGYRTAYYIAAVLYGIAALVIWFGFKSLRKKKKETLSE
ncbi:MAG: MFS transporter [Eubacterium sp.]|jgi:hypothetical protein